MATNKTPFVRNIDGAAGPVTFKGSVQAGSTQEIKAGELCVYNETSTYWVPADAAADDQYSLAIAAEQQESTDAARYMDFYALREGDVWEFELSAAASVAQGDALEISTSQKLTRDVDGNVVAFSVTKDNIEGTTVGSKSYVECVFHPHKSYWYKNIIQRNAKVVKAKTAAYTILLEDNGAIITNKGASGSVTLTAPNAVVPIGFHFYMAVMADQAFVFDPKPDTASVYIAGAAQTAGKYVSMTDIGDFAMLVWDGTDWLAVNSISGADGDISVET